MASRALLRASRAQVLRPLTRANSTAVTVSSSPIVPFVDGIPTELAREITEEERKWTFWSTSDFGKQDVGGLFEVVPEGQQWITSSGSVLTPGLKLYAGSIKAVRAIDGATIGVLARQTKSADGVVDAYAVLYTEYTDVAKTVAGDGGKDGEILLANAASTALAEAVKTVKTADGIKEADKAAIASKLLASLSSTASTYGLKLNSIDVRAAWSSSLDVPSRLVSLEPAPKAEWDRTHGLKPDYWADKLTPNFFTKFKFGNAREPEVVATPSVEWNLPSPPETHHFHGQVPKMTVSAEDAQLLTAKSH
ncbi:hypothetical protein M427DRAFT_53091 [Gonapodya prolifera JEL478]|uniref:Uncharacterized protein n=1 Tax=Gonapodya prolifera (strain JEL478) TaxID=1344416 RepID=A0A139AQS1_GONPJ|nr:hypothetical protein M427DRAFT_53091 [Gonapodya prolifera JEL478]|eukprot:KXS19107.1 hypothetical protein M427DRAFT_53091 [Gonapodya prolifera JEL478]